MTFRLSEILQPKQREAYALLKNGTHTEVLYGGAAGGGKSWLGCLWLLLSCLKYPGSRWLMGRSVAKTLKETTLNSFFDVCAFLGLKTGADYVYNGQAGIIMVGPSMILLKDLFANPSDPNFDDLGSLEITGAFIDEANQVTDKAKAIVSSRIRYKLDQFGLVPKLLMTCNPAKNWVYADFYDPWRKDKLLPYRAFVPALVHDNPNISPHYIANLEKLTGPDRERLFLGNWDFDDNPWALMRAQSINDLWTNSHVVPGRPAMTVDVARFGQDRTVIGAWNGLVLHYIEVLTNSDTIAVAGASKRVAEQFGVPRSRIVVDEGGVGGGVVDQIKGCVAFNGAAAAVKVGRDENYGNLRAQCFYRLADVVNSAGLWVQVEAYRSDITLELGVIRRLEDLAEGKLRVIKTEDIKQLIGRSPDFASMLMMRMRLELAPAGDTFDHVLHNLEVRTNRENYERFVEEEFGHLKPPSYDDRDN